MRVVFAGTPEFSAKHLEALIDAPNVDIVGVYTQPDRQSGRGKKVAQSAVKQVALTHGLPVFQPLNFKRTEDIDQLEALQCDVMVVVAYGLLLPQAVLDAPRFGCINVHASILPRWRGAAPIQRAIEAGDSETGVTIMQMEAGLDTGPMLLKTHLPIEADDTAQSLHDKLAQQGGDALKEAVDGLAAGTLSAEVQDDNLANYAEKLSKAEGELDWSKPAIELDRTVRAFNPWPVAWTLLDEATLRIWHAKAEEAEHNQTPGTVISADKTGLVIACGEGALRISTLQLPGKKSLSITDILNSGKQLFVPGETQLGQ